MTEKGRKETWLLMQTSPMDLFAARIEEEGGSLVVRPSGELDLATVPMLEDSLHEALGRGDSPVILDLTELAFIDSTGIALLLRESQGDDGTRLSIRGASAGVRRTFELTGVESILPVTD
jgi:anti-sigma B factor antagonist